MKRDRVLEELTTFESQLNVLLDAVQNRKRLVQGWNETDEINLTFTTTLREVRSKLFELERYADKIY